MSLSDYPNSVVWVVCWLCLVVVVLKGGIIASEAYKNARRAAQNNLDRELRPPVELPGEDMV
jgi:hypothetical protein